MKKFIIGALFFVPVVMFNSSTVSAKEVVKEHRIMSKFGSITTVYMSPVALKDKNYIAQVLEERVSKKKHSMIWFFDDKQHTALRVPLTDKNMLHWKARYVFNPTNKFEEFAFIEVVNKRSSPPELREIKANIGPGYAD